MLLKQSVITGLLFTWPIAAQVTFTRDVAPILYQHCVSCHHPDDVAPMSLITYQDVKPWAASIKEAVLLRKMPPWKADPHYGKWSNDPTLTNHEIETLKTWADGGKLEGDPKALPAPPVFEDGWRIGKPDAIIAIPEHRLAAHGPDEYVSLHVPVAFTEDRWVVAAELRPGVRKLVHHAHVFVREPLDEKSSGGNSGDAANDPPLAFTRWLQVRQGTLTTVRPEAPVINDGCAVDDNGKFPGPNVDELSLLSSYLPGRGPDVYPDRTARLIRKGSTLDFQIHYSRATGRDEVDKTSLGLIFAKEPPAQVSHRLDLSNNLFLIPAGAASHEVSECHSFKKDVYITSLTPHMHFRGKDMRLLAAYPDGRRETLLFVPQYNFDWQITYRPVEPIHLPKGVRIVIDAHFDNSANNPRNPDASQSVRWGAASENEMMSGWIEYLDFPPSKYSSRLR